MISHLRLPSTSSVLVPVDSSVASRPRDVNAPHRLSALFERVVTASVLLREVVFVRGVDQRDNSIFDPLRQVPPCVDNRRQTRVF